MQVEFDETRENNEPPPLELSFCDEIVLSMCEEKYTWNFTDSGTNALVSKILTICAKHFGNEDNLGHFREAINHATSTKKQNKVIEKLDTYIHAEKVPLGDGYFYYVPIESSIQLMLRDSNLLRHIQQERQGGDLDQFSYIMGCCEERRNKMKGEGNLSQ